MRRTNARGIEDRHFGGEHKTINTMRDLEDLPCRISIIKDIPQLPEIEFHISKLVHVTTKSGLEGILKSGGFQGFKGGFQGHDPHLLWWGLAIEDADIQIAEDRFLEKKALQKSMQEPFLTKFTTSPAFQMDKSRYGNFKFTFSLGDMLQMYREQICGGDGPVMRVYGTTVYKQEIMYTVIVHSPSVTEFDQYPDLNKCGDDPVCIFNNNNIVWRAQALSKTHNFRPVIHNERPNIIEVEQFVPLQEKDKWFVWDNVTVAFHVPEGQTLRLSRERLIQNLTACEAADPFIGNGHRFPLPEAQSIVAQLKVELKTGTNKLNQSDHLP
ncbi:uncharacterized protein LOC134023845 [Osmerus eperlanus]|uniref:uncharacterized protein LOC134023825 n=1 Tax=Osmerus eperlanus TaxID=29151 RepID=UPI002E0F0825